MKKEFGLLLTGILIGLLLAPAPSSVTRKKLRRVLDDLRASAEEEATELVEEGIQSMQDETAVMR